MKIKRNTPSNSMFKNNNKINNRVQNDFPKPNLYNSAIYNLEYNVEDPYKINNKDKNNKIQNPSNTSKKNSTFYKNKNGTVQNNNNNNNINNKANSIIQKRLNYFQKNSLNKNDNNSKKYRQI